MIEKQELKLQQLVNAAIDMFHENGFQNARVSDIVGKAGVAQGTFYLYFKSKDDIFLHICKKFTALFSNMLEDSQDLFSGDSYEEVHGNLLKFTRELITLFAANEKMAKILFFEGGGYGGKFRQVYEGIYKQFVHIIGGLLEKSKQTGYTSFEDAETEAIFLIGLFDRSLFYFMDVKKNVDIHALSHRMTDFILGGLSKNMVKISK